MGATLPILLPVFRHRVVHQLTSKLFVVDDCRNFFPVEHFGASIPVFSARFSVVFSCFNFAFCSTTYVRPLSHLFLLGFVTFVFFRFRCHLFFILRCQLFFFRKSSALPYYLSFLLPDGASAWAQRCQFYCLFFYFVLFFNLHQCFSS